MNPASILGYLSKNSRKTECGADLFLVRLAVRARTLYASEFRRSLLS